jgi:hypothetical protein
MPILVSLVLEGAVKRGVHLNGGKFAGIIIEPAFFGHILGIKATLPVVVCPPGGADKKDLMLW